MNRLPLLQWTCSQVDGEPLTGTNSKKEYDLTDWEADTMQEELEKLADQYVENSDGHMINYDAAVEMMDDDLREELHREMAPCTNQEFYDAYVKAHAAKYNGEKFQI